MTSLCLCREGPGEIAGRKPFDRLNNVFLERLKILSCEYLERLPRPTNPTRHVDWVFWNLITKCSLHFVDQQFIFWTQIDFLDQTPFELTNDFRSRKKSGYWRVHRKARPEDSSAGTGFLGMSSGVQRDLLILLPV